MAALENIVIARPLPDELRQLGFEHAKKSDVFTHKRILLDLWRSARRSSAAPAPSLARA